VEARAKLEQAEEFCRMLKEWGKSREDSLGMRKASEADGWCRRVASLTSELRRPVPQRYAVAFN